MSNQVEKALLAVQEFVGALRDFETSNKELQKYEALVNRCLKNDPKTNKNTVLEVYTRFAENNVAFLENDQTIKLLPRDTKFSYDKGGQISVPIGQIIFKSRGTPQIIRGIRTHLLVICILTCKNQTTLTKLKTLFEQTKPKQATSEDPSDKEEDFDEKDMEFFKSLPQLPGMDFKEFAKIGKEAFSDMEAPQDGQDMRDKIIEGVGNLIYSPMFANLIQSVEASVKNGGSEQLQAQGMQQLFALGQAFMNKGMIPQELSEPSPPSTE